MIHSVIHSLAIRVFNSGILKTNCNRNRWQKESTFLFRSFQFVLLFLFWNNFRATDGHRTQNQFPLVMACVRCVCECVCLRIHHPPLALIHCFKSFEIKKKTQYPFNGHSMSTLHSWLFFAFVVFLFSSRIRSKCVRRLPLPRWFVWHRYSR